MNARYAVKKDGDNFRIYAKALPNIRLPHSVFSNRATAEKYARIMDAERAALSKGETK